MNNQLTKPNPPGDITQQKISDYLDAFGLTQKLNANEKKQFIDIACEFQLNPFKREIYCVPFGEGDNRKLSIIVGYEVYIKRAERTGLLNGWRATIEGTGDDVKAVVEIHRKDWSNPFIHETFWKEAAQFKHDGSLTQFWKKQPRFQLKKVAISQAFRMCFPDELGGMGYDSSELPIDLPEPPPTIPDSVTSTKPDSSPPFDTNPLKLAPKPEIQPPSRSPRTPRPVKPVTPIDPDTEAFTSAIQTMLSTNELSFPSAHVNWIRSQLSSNPTTQRLEEILTHMQQVINSAPTVKPEPVVTPEKKEPVTADLIF